MKNYLKIGGKTISLVAITATIIFGGVFVATHNVNALVQMDEQYDGGGGGGGGATYYSVTTVPDEIPTTTRTECVGSTKNTYVRWGAYVRRLCTTATQCTNTSMPSVENMTGTMANSPDCPGYVAPAALYDASTWPASGSTVTLQWCTNGATATYDLECNGSTQEVYTVTPGHNDTTCTAVGTAKPIPSEASVGLALLPDSADTVRYNYTQTCTSVWVPGDKTLVKSNPDSINCPVPCTSSPNACGATSSGTKAGGICSAITPPNPPKFGEPCDSPSNSCGGTKKGTIGCDGLCTEKLAPPNPANYGKACTSSPNACGATDSRTIGCDGTCPAVTPSNPQPCTSAANACGARGSGYMCGGVCNATKPAEPQPCQSSANSCGLTNVGKICGGVCDATRPSDSECKTCRSPSNACGGFSTGIILANGACSVTTAPAVNMTTNPKYGQACTASNICGQSNPGTYLCANMGCSVSAPANPGACQSGPNACGMRTSGTYNCAGVCPVPPPPDSACGQCSATNACGQSNAGVIVNGSCNATAPALPPNYNNVCTSAANVCGMTTSARINCSGVCPAARPADNLCPTSCTSAPNSCGQTTTGTSVAGVCDAVTPPNPVPAPGSACTSAANSCGMKNTGTYNCAGTCSASKPLENLCPSSCTSAPNSCGQTSSGTSVGGVCNAVTPANPAIYVTTGLCTAPLIIPVGGLCNTTVVDECITGSWKEVADNATQHLWTCEGIAGGKDASCAITKVVVPTPVVTINPAVKSIQNGAVTTFTWSAANTTAEVECNRYRNGAPDGVVGLSGTFNSPSLNTNTTYEVNCVNRTGSAPFPSGNAFHSVTVAPVPAPVITVTPATSNITSGQTTTFSWNVTNSTTCRLFKDGLFVEVVPPVRSFTSGALTSNTEYAVSCVNETGPGPYPTAVVNHNVFVTAVPPGPPILTIVERPVQYNNISFGESHTQRLTIRNDGDSLLTGAVSISNNYTNVFKLQTTDTTFSLAKGSTKTFYVTFSPIREKSDGKVSFLKRLMASAGIAAIKSFSITSSAAIVITSNAGNQNVPIEGTGVEMVSGDTIMNVGDVPVGVSRTFTYPVRNNTLTPVNACLKLTPSSAFLCGSSSKCSKIVNAGGQALFNIVFSPTSIRSFGDTVTVGTEEADGSCKSIFDMEVTGNGVKPVSTFIER